MNNKENKQLGNQGENLAAEFLENQNFQIIARNYHSCYGEIDLIAIDSDELVFIEVKTRSSSLENALTSISKSKQNKLYKTAAVYLASHPRYEEWFTRFDVVVVLSQQNQDQPKIEHLVNAFSAV
ncbi:MAG: YraN family protein [Candidatus Cloacimonadales bacterium]